MGKDLKKYIILSGFNIRDNNRGTAALSYGAVSFLVKEGFLKPGMEILNIRSVKNPFKKENRDVTDCITVGGEQYTAKTVNILEPFWQFLLKYGITIPGTRLHRLVKHTLCVAAINGGDGFSDIYNTSTFRNRLPDSLMALKVGIPVIILPQTLGPFEQEENRLLAETILKGAAKVYARDNKYENELKKIGVEYTLTNDLSYFMRPESFDIDIPKNAVGINVSGLAYSNTFRTLSGQFDNYPLLISKIIHYFLENTEDTIYLISHSYNYQRPEASNDDIVACKEAYKEFRENPRIVLIDRDLTSPQTKYVISRMKFFIGTRMHANFAAIFTKVPLFGLAYSYKFEGAFKQNGIENRTAMINNITPDQADEIVTQIAAAYHEDTAKR